MPISLLQSSQPSFDNFILAAHKAKPEDDLIVQEGVVSTVSPSCHIAKYTNRKTWNAFKSAVQSTFTKEKINWICKRYNFNWDKASAGRLKRRHVEYFGVGAGSVRLKDLKGVQSVWRSVYRFFTGFGSASVDEVRKLYARATVNSFLVDKQDPRKLSGAPRELHENFATDQFRIDQQRSNLYLGIGDLLSQDPKIPRLHRYFSRLSMTITCLLEDPSKVNQEFVIPAPGVNDGEIDYYRVHKIISKKGLTAVALVPVSDASYLQPIISFRCTKQAPSQSGFFDSILNNGERQIGKSGYEACKDELLGLMEDLDFTRGKKVKVLAYSQGGSHAGFFLSDILEGYWRIIDEFIGFNFVGNDDPRAEDQKAQDNRVIERIAQQINSLPEYEVPPSFTIHRNIGDWVNGSGKRHIGWGIKHPNSIVRVYEWKIDDFAMPTKNPRDPTQFNPWHHLHGARPMDCSRDSSNPYEYNLYKGPTQCDPILDTYRRDPTLEDIRQEFGHEVIHRAVSLFYEIGSFLVRIFGIQFLRRYFEEKI
ncbi:MAG: hypothetical protein JSS30_05535 [Verrucomicrobia bacterium]|nr:hypothetical protein [Verrucomicrobiota bacterium]